MASSVRVGDHESNIIDVAGPEAYLEDSDKRILHEFTTDLYGTANLISTPKALHQIACAEISLIASDVYQLREEPEYLCAVIETSIFHRPELVHDASGKAPDVSELLANAQCIAQELRYTIHNTLLELGQWVLISQYLKDVCELEEKLGYGESLGEKKRLMNAAKNLTEQAMEIAATRTARAVRRHPNFEGYIVRNYDHVPKWTGSELELVSGPEASGLLESRNLHGALFRLCCIRNMEAVEGYSCTEDLIKEFSKATPAQHEELGDHLVDSISRVKAFWDFYQVLGFRDKTEPHSDRRLVQFRDNSVNAQKLLDAAPIERYIKGIASLGQENAVRKIWLEIDKLTEKRVSCTIEKLIGYQKPTPRWYIAPRQTPMRPTTPTDTNIVPARAPRPPKASSAPSSASEPVQEPEPANIKPYSYLSGIQPEAESVESETTTRVGPKVKRTGVAEERPLLGHQPIEAPPPEGSDAPALRIPYPVRKWDYEVFEKIFDLSVKGTVKQLDFIQAMGRIGFSLQQAAGSRFTMEPPQGYQPFKGHLLHNGDFEMNVARRRSCAKRLTEDYGLTLASFRTSPS
ncbi:hypothetical protein M413DRAFT_448440 [Hebeloma cylindrosporum]|uniref:Uncharacterized protein n=1 Tax=Hebeloma cylindrosporum TaxID=76867 RepID=A0A0C2XHM9_HEBCY|nr:hypothetical protein M413DRAFT_448440 [Hebeloma cylindrosporum h7]